MNLSRIINALLAIFIVFFTSSVFADPPTTVARISAIEGPVSLSPQGGSWIDAELNRPVIPGDSLWADANTRMELQLDAAVLRIADGTALRLASLDNNAAQFELPQGRLYLHVFKFASNQTYEVDTPNAVFTTSEPGSYLIEVDSETNKTTVSVFEGTGSLYGQTGESVTLITPKTYVLIGNDITQLQTMELIGGDDFISWCQSRDEKLEQAYAEPIAAPKVVGYGDLNTYGTWTDDPDYGHIWSPSSVSEDWAPYREGHWESIEPWGWTWIDDEPWGFAPYHYGRWLYVHGHWYWVPGPMDVEPVYAPALVVFIGSGDYMVADNDFVAWFPLGPGDPYIPPYAVSYNYFISINITNTKISNYNKFYNKHDANFVYRNANLPQGITAVRKNAFLNQRNLRKDLLPMPEQKLQKLKYTQRIMMQPSGISRGQISKVVPPKSVLNKKVFMKSPVSPQVPIQKIKTRPMVLPKEGRPTVLHLPPGQAVRPPKMERNPSGNEGLPPALFIDEKKKLPKPVRIQDRTVEPSGNYQEPPVIKSRPHFAPPNINQSTEPVVKPERPIRQPELKIYHVPNPPQERVNEHRKFDEQHIQQQQMLTPKPLPQPQNPPQPVQVTPPTSTVIVVPPAATPHLDEVKKRREEHQKNN